MQVQILLSALILILPTMKNIDKIILKTFIKNFLMVAVIVIFILLIQIFLQNMKDIMGKNLGFKLYRTDSIIPIPLIKSVISLSNTK